ncbi:hypothetical protein M501DRAFT_1015020 [Patellaria atrata CBS 101060]|uniref:Uncharacterized protein n=1 Tax=Patellaria atrata CBS 101060 TaxID=1346257 RepID=A0A9P4VUW7_9PEZI|nr:hypothetical protein M501DRAFT_1015020 [Patellaria atrata CBS 101060]
MNPTLSRLAGLISFPKLRTNFSYEKLPEHELSSASTPFSPLSWRKFRWRSLSPKDAVFSQPRFSARLIVLATAVLLFLSAIIAGGIHRRNKWVEEHKKPKLVFPWELYPKLGGFYNGVKLLVPYSDYVSEQNFNTTTPDSQSPSFEAAAPPSSEPILPLDPDPFNPYPQYESLEFFDNFQPIEQCYLDDEENVHAPDIYAYPGVPQNMTEPFFGSYEELTLTEDKCFDRFGRFAPYGYGYNPEDGGLGLGDKSERAGSEKIFDVIGKIDYRKMDWGKAQAKCYEKNKQRYHDDSQSDKKKLVRQAFVLRVWTGYKWNPYRIMTLRAMINELSLKSGGEYDVHLLLHVKDENIPIFASEEIYNRTIHENLPEEFWGLATLWSVPQMRAYYPGPFDFQLDVNPKGEIHGVYRSPHMPLQWFAQQHPEYDYFWNWEMDLRYSGHYYELTSRIADWATKQPRKGLWERSAWFWIPRKHGNWNEFSTMVDQETANRGKTPIWGPLKFENTGMLPSITGTIPPSSYEEDNNQWGVDEPADFISFNPLFDVEVTNWPLRNDINGYNSKFPPPPRRAAIVTVSRLSRRLLQTMHDENVLKKRNMFAEMFPPTMCLHYGLKAVYAPHPVYFDHNWDLEYMDKIFNYPQKPHESPFGWGEHNLKGSSFYYNSDFAPRVWRRWLGEIEGGEGGAKQENEGSGRMCLRGMLFHPIKREDGPE